MNTVPAVESEMRKKPVLLVGMILMMLPVLLVAGILWHTFSAQIEASYEKRLNTSLSVLELSIGRSVDDFRNSLSRLAADNTLKVTVDLDIRPQLKRYLEEQFQISRYRYVQVANAKGEALVTLGDQSQAHAACEYPNTLQTEHAKIMGGLLLISRSIRLGNQQDFLGYLCAGYAVNGKANVDAAAPRIDGTALLGWEGVQVPFGSESIPLDQETIASGLFVTDYSGGRYRGKVTDYRLDGHKLKLYVLVDMQQYQDLFTHSILITSVIVVAFLMLAAFSARMLSSRQRAVGELQVERERAGVTLASIADGVVTTDRDGYVTYVNPAAKRLLRDDLDQMIGLPWREVFDLQNEITGKRVADFNASEAEGQSSVDSILLTNDGRRIAVHYSAAKMYENGHYSGSVVTFRDMHKERELRRRLAWKASRDDLTGLLNRSEFSRCVSETIDALQDDKTHHCLLYLDLDEFKVVNDSCGHKAGDELLRKVSAGLKSQLRESDVLARLGGDEFGLLLLDCRREQGIEVAKGLIDSINDQRFAFQDKVFHVGASIGLVSVTRRTTNLEDLLATVDAACYAAKEEGRNRVFVGQVDGAKISHRMEDLRQASHIRHALKEGRMMLYKQPIVSPHNPGQILHSEVLVRMVEEDGKLVVPGAFIPIAERHGLMREVDRWVISHLFEIEGDNLRRLRCVGRNEEREHDVFLYSINLSAASLTDPTFLDYVKEQLKAHGIPGHSIAFEITETEVITHLDKAEELIRSLRELGCKFLLDDFGSGMSSFGYLKKLPIDYLKIDGLFVKDILTDPIDRSMVVMINDIGHIMNLTTVAEYVEDEKILEEIKAIGVDLAQGYGISKPQPMEDVPVIRTTNIA